MAYGSNYIDQYRKAAVNTASPLQLIIMLYDGALRFMNAGKAAMERHDLFEQNKNLQKAQKIVAELMSCLNMEAGGEVAQNLLSLYTFVYNRLVMANVEEKPEYIDECDRVLRELRESWAIIDANQRAAVGAEELPNAA